MPDLNASKTLIIHWAVDGDYSFNGEVNMFVNVRGGIFKCTTGEVDDNPTTNPNPTNPNPTNPTNPDPTNPNPTNPNPTNPNPTNPDPTNPNPTNPNPTNPTNPTNPNPTNPNPTYRIYRRPRRFRPNSPS